MSEKTVRKLFNQAFSGHRTQRSNEYKMGCIAALRYRISKAAIICPFNAGSVEFDAYHAGIDEGHAIWREEGE